MPGKLLKLRIQLATDRQASRASGWAAELKFAATHRAEPDVAAEVMYEVAVAQRRNEPRAATKIFEDLLEAFPKTQPWADVAAYEVARSGGMAAAAFNAANEAAVEEFLAGRIKFLQIMELVEHCLNRHGVPADRLSQQDRPEDDGRRGARTKARSE